MMMNCFIGVGSNLSTPLEQAQHAIRTIAALENVTLVACSSLYGSKPMGPQDQPDYINAVIQIKTTLSPIALLDQLQKIEQQQGRERKDQRWGARTLDLDILLYNNECIESERLTIPHYGMYNREFVLYPLEEIAPNIVFPDGRCIAELTNNLARNGLTKLAPVSLIPISEQ